MGRVGFEAGGVGIGLVLALGWHLDWHRPRIGHSAEAGWGRVGLAFFRFGSVSGPARVWLLVAGRACVRQRVLAGSRATWRRGTWVRWLDWVGTQIRLGRCANSSVYACGVLPKGWHCDRLACTADAWFVDWSLWFFGFWFPDFAVVFWDVGCFLLSWISLFFSFTFRALFFVVIFERAGFLLLTVFMGSSWRV